jgi:hypothetical protein
MNLLSYVINGMKAIIPQGNQNRSMHIYDKFFVGDV